MILLRINSVLNKVAFYLTLQVKKYIHSSEDNEKVYFSNANTDKLEILKAGKDKSGLYMWTNNLTGKRYIGSSIDLRRRFLEYFNTNTLLRD